METRKKTHASLRALCDGRIFAVKFKVEYENGETAVVDCRNTEPVGDYLPPEIGMNVCSKVRGTKYQAKILELVEV